MREGDGRGECSSYGDAIPGGGWSCRQTYLRNHLMMDVALRSLSRLRDDSRSPLRILDIGGGVIEPLLLAALVRARFPGVPCTIHLVDPSEDVITLLQAARNGSRWERDWQGEAIVAFDPAAGVLSLSALSKVFSSPESPINPHLAEAAALRAPVGELERIGVLGFMGLPDESAQAIDALSTNGLPVPRESVAMIEPRRASVLEIDPTTEPYDLIVANFSIQYPIVEGHADEVAARLSALLAPRGVIAHGATYGAQAHLMRALCTRDESFGVVFGIRELDEVVYVNDTEGAVTRLRIRTDAIFTRMLDERTGEILGSIVPPMPSSAEIVQAPLSVLVAAIDPSDGLTRPRLAAALGGAGQGRYRCWWTDRRDLLASPQPLPCRLK